MIVDKIRDTISCTQNETTSLSAEERMLVTLRYLATGPILQVVGDFAGIDKSTASRAIYKVVSSIAQLHRELIKMPETQDELEIVKQQFYAISRFPRCIGAIDCTHIRIQSPGGNNAEIFRNRKGYFHLMFKPFVDLILLFKTLIVVGQDLLMFLQYSITPD